MSTEICKLKNDELLLRTKSLAVEERKVTLQILHYLREISRRRLFALRGFGSLFEYTTRELGYSDAAAQRRIAAMKLLSEIPEVEEKIKKGEISLSNAAQAQKLFQGEANLKKPIPLEKKKAILDTISNKSSREAEKELIRHSSQPIHIQRPDSVKAVTPTHSEIRFVADQELLDQMEQVKGLLAHRFPHLTFAELFKEMARLSLDKLRPKAPKQEMQHEAPAHSSDAGVEVDKSEVQSVKKAATDKRYIPAELRRVVFQRDQGRCQYVDSMSERKCCSTFAIQFDHIIPFGRGGTTTASNLRLLCAVHNRMHAVQVYGERKMSSFLKSG